MKDIRGTTKTIALIGNPTEHSLSPLIHNNLSFLTRTDAAYITFCVKKDNLSEAIKGAYALGIHGLNITVPYKQDVIKELTGIDPLAEAIGAVNTLVRTNDGYYGYNTDILGFLKELEYNDFYIQGRDVVLLGAGGVARAIAFACAREGAKNIYILNRTKEKAELIANDINAYFNFEREACIHPLPLSASEDITASDFLFVQTTDVGMYPRQRDVLLENTVLYEKCAFGFDVIYNPYETVFMKKLRRLGKKCVNGLPMLLYQGIEAYKMWFKDATLTTGMERQILEKLHGALFPHNDDMRARRHNGQKDNLIFVGFMGSGKSTLGRWVAKHSGKILLDTDYEIEKEQGRSIREIFETDGEEAFRNIETEYLRKLSASGRSGLVISVGGGTPLREENRELLKKIGAVIYLKASSTELFKRLQYDERRPLLAGKSGAEREALIEKMLEEREPAYTDAANLVVKTDGVYFPRIYQIINKRLKGYSYGNNRKKSRNKVYEYGNGRYKDKFSKNISRSGSNENTGYKRT